MRSAARAGLRHAAARGIDYQSEDFTRVLPGGFDVVFDGIGEDNYRRSFAALKRSGLLCAYGYTAGVQPQSRLSNTLIWLARVYLWRQVLSWLPGGERLRLYSINLMRHPQRCCRRRGDLRGSNAALDAVRAGAGCGSSRC